MSLSDEQSLNGKSKKFIQTDSLTSEARQAGNSGIHDYKINRKKDHFSNALPCTEDRIINLCLPDDPTNHAEVQKCIFRFARGVRYNLGSSGSHTELKRLALRYAELSKIEGVVLDPLEIVLPFLMQGFSKARYPLGFDVPAAYEVAKSTPQYFGDEFTEKQWEVLNTCYNLSDAEGRFFLSPYSIDSLVGMTPNTIYAWLNMFVKTGWIKVIKKGKPRVSATEYQFLKGDKSVLPEDWSLEASLS